MAAMVGVPLFKQQSTGKAFTSSQKQTILNVYSSLREREPSKSKNDVVTEAAKLTGVSIKSVCKMITEVRANNGRLSTPGKTRPGAVGKRTRMQMYDELTRSSIRRKVHDFYWRNEIPTVNKVMDAVDEDPALPSLGRTAMQNMMKTLNFYYSKGKRESFLMERDEIVLWRRRYLRAMKNYRQQCKPVYFLDETCLSVDSTGSCKQTSLDGSTSGSKVQKKEAQKLVILHAGNENGFVSGAELVFLGKNTGNYQEIDGEHFEKWFVEQLLPNLESNSVIVMDNAPCHCVKLEKIPTKDSHKDEMQSWLSSKGIAWDPTMLKIELMQIIQRLKFKYDMYRIDNLAMMSGHMVLRLPPNHSDLNPFELVWSTVKGYISAQNCSFKWREVEELLPKALACVTEDKWADFVCHTQKEVDKMWELDSLAEVIIENIQYNEPSDEEMSDADEGMDPYYEVSEVEIEVELRE